MRFLKTLVWASGSLIAITLAVIVLARATDATWWHEWRDLLAVAGVIVAAIIGACGLNLAYWCQMQAEDRRARSARNREAVAVASALAGELTEIADKLTLCELALEPFGNFERFKARFPRATPIYDRAFPRLHVLDPETVQKLANFYAELAAYDPDEDHFDPELHAISPIRALAKTRERGQNLAEDLQRLAAQYAAALTP